MYLTALSQRSVESEPGAGKLTDVEMDGRRTCGPRRAWQGEPAVARLVWCVERNAFCRDQSGAMKHVLVTVLTAGINI